MAISQTVYSACKCTNTSQACGSKTDPGTYYVCNGSNTVTLTCAAGSGFLANSASSLCVPYTDPAWNCGSQYPVKAPTACYTAPVMKNAREFWVCEQTTENKQSEFCVGSTFFYRDDNQLGCYAFNTWITLTSCVDPTYYF